jgi:membrane protein YqaA with SNARE-associated domain
MGKTSTEPPPAGWRIHRRLYDWVLHWALTPYSLVALFLLAFAESSFFPIPPDALLIALVLGSTQRWALFAGLCTLGSVLGGVAGYGIGMFLMDTVGVRVIDFYNAQTHFEKVAEWYQQYDFWIVFAAAFTPIPYKVFTLASGAFQINVVGFALASTVGRGARFFMVAGLLRLVGQPMRRFIDRYFDLLAVAFVALLIGGFLVIRYVR